MISTVSEVTETGLGIATSPSSCSDKNILRLSFPAVCAGQQRQTSTLLSPAIPVRGCPRSARERFSADGDAGPSYAPAGPVHPESGHLVSVEPIGKLRRSPIQGHRSSPESRTVSDFRQRRGV